MVCAVDRSLVSFVRVRALVRAMCDVQCAMCDVLECAACCLTDRRLARKSTSMVHDMKFEIIIIIRLYIIQHSLANSAYAALYYNYIVVSLSCEIKWDGAHPLPRNRQWSVAQVSLFHLPSVRSWSALFLFFVNFFDRHTCRSIYSLFGTYRLRSTSFFGVAQHIL
jgi:hypothetical protein